MLDAKAILAADDLDKVEVNLVEEWGGSVYVRMLTGAEAESLFSDIADTNKGKIPKSFMLRMVVMTMCDAEGNQLIKDVANLGKKGWGPIKRIFEAAMTLNGMGEDAVEDAAKNSKTTPDEPSGSS